jgi:hypothetical protein
MWGVFNLEFKTNKGDTKRSSMQDKTDDYKENKMLE